MTYTKQMCGLIVLAGGKGSRMGYCDKARLVLQGETLIKRLERETEGFGERLLSRQGQLTEKTAFKVIQDKAVDCGPLAGIVATLEEAQYLQNVVIACDMPYMTEACLTWLVAHYKGEEALICRTQDGRIQPLCALYHKDCLPVFQKALQENKYSLMRAIEQMHYRVLDVPEQFTTCFYNMNTLDAYTQLTQEAPHKR